MTPTLQGHTAARSHKPIIETAVVSIMVIMMITHRACSRVNWELPLVSPLPPQITHMPIQYCSTSVVFCIGRSVVGARFDVVAGIAILHSRREITSCARSHNTAVSWPMVVGSRVGAHSSLVGLCQNKYLRTPAKQPNIYFQIRRVCVRRIGREECARRLRLDMATQMDSPFQWWFFVYKIFDEFVAAICLRVGNLCKLIAFAQSVRSTRKWMGCEYGRKKYFLLQKTTL